MFWMIAAILTLIALAFVLPSLLRQPKITADEEMSVRRQQNIHIAKEQLEELEQRFEQGEMDETNYQATRDELESALYDDVNEAEQNVASTSVSKKSLLSTLAIALIIPAIAVGMYQKLGNPVFISSISAKEAAKVELQKNVPKNADGTPDIDTMVAGLQKKMEADPKNVKGWYMLGRSFMVLKRFPDAVKAYEKAYKLKPDSPDIMLSLADSLSMTNGGDISGRPTKLINEALKVDPNNLTALWLGGMAARQQQDPVTAIKRWRLALVQLKDPTEIQEINSLITEASKLLKPEQKAALKLDTPVVSAPVAPVAPTPPINASAPTVAPVKATTPKASNSAGVSVTVSLSEKFKSQVKPTDLVFIYAKAVTGPPMPLAAARKQVKDLPLEIILDDSMAMMPTMKISDFGEVIIGARVSKSGEPIAQNGDLFAEKKPIKAGEKVSLEIDSVVVK